MSSPEQTITSQITETPTPVNNEPSAPLLPEVPKRSERRVKLVLKDGLTIECLINPTLMWIKQKFKEAVRRQQIIASKLAGIEERRKTLHAELQKASADNDPTLPEKEKALDTLYEDVAKLEEQNKKLNYDLAGYSVHLPTVKDKQVTKDEIDWDSCEEDEVMKAQSFFLLP